MEKHPKVIFLDAVGTLFGVKDGVGQVYATMARQAGVDVGSDRLEHSFRAAFRASTPPFFPGVDADNIPDREFQWWEAIAKDTFTRAGVIEQFENFSEFFSLLYTHFATPDPWFIFADVVPSLEAWHDRGIELGVISNFDTRLYDLLESLGIKHYFRTITISSIVGAAKPDQKIFLDALDKHDCPPGQALHIGDSKVEDYEGAIKVGIKPYLLKRKTENDYPYNRQLQES